MINICTFGVYHTEEGRRTEWKRVTRRSVGYEESSTVELHS